MKLFKRHISTTHKTFTAIPLNISRTIYIFTPSTGHPTIVFPSTLKTLQDNHADLYR